MLRAEQHPSEGINSILETIERKVQTALYVQAREKWDCFAFMLIESDFAGHRYWKYYDPGSPQYRADAPEELRHGLPKVYSAIDNALGRLMAADPDAGVLIFSDHGFGGASTKTVFLNRFLEQQGLLKFAGSAAVPGSLGARVSLGGGGVAPQGYRAALPARAIAHAVAALDENRQPNRIADSLWRNRTGAARSRTPTSRHISPLCGSILPAARAAVSCRRTSTRNSVRG